MKRLYPAWASGCCLLLLVAGTAAAQGPLREYASTEGGFRLLLPGTPVRTIRPVDSPAGTLRVYGFEGELAGGKYYLLYRDYPEAYLKSTPPETLLDQARDAALAALEARTAGEQRIRLGEAPGREVRGETAAGTATLHRFYLSGSRLYEVAAVVPKEKVGASDVTRLLSSFRIVERVDTTWREVVSKDGRFSVLSPGAPNWANRPFKGAWGPTVLHSFIVQVGGDNFMAGFNDYQPQFLKDVPAEEVLDSARDGALRSLKGRLVEEKDLKLNGHTGREVVFDAGTQRLRGRLYLVGNRLYQVVAAVQKERLASPDAARFLDSFRLLPR